MAIRPTLDGSGTCVWKGYRNRQTHLRTLRPHRRRNPNCRGGLRRVNPVVGAIHELPLHWMEPPIVPGLPVNKIDKLVNELYSLTDEEIRIMEGEG